MYDESQMNVRKVATISPGYFHKETINISLSCLSGVKIIIGIVLGLVLCLFVFIFNFGYLN